MKIIQRSIELKANDYYKQHLYIVNAILPVKLTNKEIEVLSIFLSYDKKLIEKDMFNSIVRKGVMDNIGLSPGGLGNHLVSMIKKGFLDKDNITKKITIKEYLIPNDDIQGYQIKIQKKDI